jgi:hypothetical protein
LGEFAVGVGWVYCFLSRREGDRREAGYRKRQIPFLNSLEMVRLFGVPDVGGAGCAGLQVAETLICKVPGERVSLKSCSGAIRDCGLVVVVPGVSVV